jgi:hypothetical protein
MEDFIETTGDPEFVAPTANRGMAFAVTIFLVCLPLLILCWLA